MRQETIKLFKFDELSKEVQEQVLNKNREINVEWEWWELEDMLLEPTKEDIEKLKLQIEPGYPIFQYKIGYFSLDRNRYLQLDDIEVSNKEIFRKILDIPRPLWENTYWTFENKNNGDSNTKLYLELDGPGEEDDLIVEYLEGIADDCYCRAEEIWADMMNRAWKRLDESYYALMEDDSIAETIRCNEYEFLENGERWI